MKPIKLYTDLSVHLYEGEAAKKRGAPTPITYLTQWKIVGNSEVHTLPYPDGVVLPTGYKRCKYLEAHGTEYIELPIGFYLTDEVEMTVSFTETNLSDKFAVVPKTWNTNRNKFGFGIHKVSQQYIFVVAYAGQGTSITYLSPTIQQDTNVHTFTYANELFKLDNSSSLDVSSYIFGDESDNLRLFYGYNTPTKCRIYSYHQVKEDETEINLIPCLDDNNVPCLYDTVSGTSFYNDGTGTFGYEIEPQPTEIWSCGEYSEIDNKYHIVVLPQGKSPVDIALDEPLRKVNDVADSIEFPSETEGKALVTRPFGSILIGNRNFSVRDTKYADYKRFMFMTGVKPVSGNNVVANGLCSGYNMITNNQTYNINADGTGTAGIGIDTGGNCYVFDPNYNTASDANAIKAANADTEFIYELATPITELVDAPQIEEADSYTCVISQGAKAVEWSGFETE